MEMVNQRFGPEAVQDCLMAVSACLMAGLHSEDAIFHWSDSSLLAVLLGRPNEFLLDAELRRIASKNSDINVEIGGRSIMLRIPLTFELTPIDRFKSANDLYKLTMQGVKKW
jgi:GGDEF domain-containing protein